MQPLKASQGSLFVQEGAGHAPEYIGCVDVDAIPDPRGGITLLRCRDGNGDFQTVGETQDAPDTVTTTVTAWVYPDADILDRIADDKCQANIFATLRDCGKAGQFHNWVRASVLHHARLTNLTNANFVMREAADAATRALEFAGWGVHQLRNKIKFNRQSVAETTALNALAMDAQTVCAGDCGGVSTAGQKGFAGGDAPAGSPTDRADIWHTINGGTDWENTPGAAGHPFVAGQDILAAALYDIDRATKRWLVAREIVVGEPLKVAYSDDDGDTWTLVTVGATNGEGVTGPKCLIAIDREHIWIATSDGNVYFSDDGGVSFDVQSGAVTADGGASLNAIAFADVDNGYAVGDDAALIKTDDGGLTWEAVTGPDGITDDFTAVAVFSAFRVEIGTDADDVWQTWTGGDEDDWEEKTFTGQSNTGTVKVLAPANDLVVFMLHAPLTGQHYVHRSIDGGHSFERLTTPANSGINDLVVINPNLAFVVGEANGGTGFIGKISA